MLVIHIIQFTEDNTDRKSTACYCNYKGRKFVFFFQWFSTKLAPIRCQESILFYESLPQNTVVQLCWMTNRSLFFSVYFTYTTLTPLLDLPNPLEESDDNAVRLYALINKAEQLHPLSASILTTDPDSSGLIFASFFFFFI